MTEIHSGSDAIRVNPWLRASLWSLTAAMVLIIGLKSHGGPLPASLPLLHWHWIGWPLVAAGLWFGRKSGSSSWSKTAVLLTYLIVVLFFTRIDGDTGDAHVLELALALGLGILLVPALLAKYWLKEPLDYSWFNGPWSRRMWIWLPSGFVVAYVFMWLYFNILTPDLHHSWPLPLEGDRSGALWRLFWGCNFVGVWDELAFINFVFVLLCRHFRFAEANIIQAIFFTSFLYEMAFVGWGPVVIYLFALVQGLTYHKTRSLFYIVILHLMIDSILFYMIVNRWYPGWGWHPW
ncbi:MAG: CPBP family intramembrane metalloprotease [Gemmatimonadales bacterium]|nr:CPBP family intramembrane metalloprotease [Gemmatimonadales bacterium]